MRLEMDDNNWIAFTNVRADTGNQKCTYCHNGMRKGELGVSIKKKGTWSQYNIWLHTHCLINFLKDLENFFNRKKEKIISEKL